MLRDMKLFQLFFLITGAFFVTLVSCDDGDDRTGNNNENPPLFEGVLAGSRVSSYGFGGVDSVPSPEQLTEIYLNMAEACSNATPSAIWIVTGINESDGTCHVEFPAPDGYENEYITFWPGDWHTPYLEKLDEIGAKIFLQIESGQANVEELIKLVLDKYGHHECVVGFGVDVEWYRSDGRPNYKPASDSAIDIPVTDSAILVWDSLIKEYNSNYRLFLKHWQPEQCGSGALSDIIYVNDSQRHAKFTDLLRFYKEWGDYFAPNALGFQYGYASDSLWWKEYDEPFSTIADSVALAFPERELHYYWVDFTLDHPKMKQHW